MSTLLVLPEPVPWASLVRAELQSEGQVRVVSPPAPTRLTDRLPAAQRIRARLAWRRAVDRLACRQVTAELDRVVAPSLAAARTFARAHELGVRTELIEDLPDLADLHAHLDAAAHVHPDRPFLRNHRASRQRVVRQGAERVLADRVRVQGRFAAERVARLAPHATVDPLFPPVQVPAPRPRPLRIVRLAGPAMTRTGLVEALGAVERMPGLALQIRPIDATPRALLRHPRVRTDRAPADGVLAPAWVECWPVEVRQAAREGLPVLGTRRALGFVSGIEVAPGSVHDLVTALEAVQSAGIVTPAPACTGLAPRT